MIAALVPGLLAYNWNMSLGPKLKAEAESNAIALAHSQADSLADALSPPSGEIRPGDVVKAIDNILLLIDPNTNNQFINQVRLELDYDVVKLQEGSLDIEKGKDNSVNYFIAEIPIYSKATKELLGIATFHVSSESFQDLQHEVKNDFFLGAIFALLLLVGSWFIVFSLLRPMNVIVAAAKGLRNGKYPQVPPIETSDELSQLSTEFNNMSQAIKDREEELMYSQKRIRDLFERVEHAIFRMDSDFKVIESNGRFSELCDLNTDFFCLIDEDKRESFVKKALEGKLVGKEIVITAKDDHEHIIQLSVYPEVMEDGSIVGYDGHFVDITDRKKLEETLRQNQKLESLGLLAGGIAHDFNNILSVIIGYSDIVSHRMTEDNPLRPKIKEIQKQGIKAADLTRQLLAFSRKQVMELKVLNLNSLINNMAHMLDRLIGETIEMKLLLHTSTGNIKADPGQIEQIIMNLAVNAKDAMPEGGSLFFETESLVLNDEYCKSHDELSPGRYIVLTITDTGHGMTPEVKEKIFDPFYTTKAKGAGTGLGLSTVYGIVKQLKGYIIVYSEAGLGTTFKIFFPEIHEAEEEVSVNSTTQENLLGGETILVIDDETAIRSLICDTLQPLGYNVLVAASDEKAQEWSEKSGITIDLLLTDVVMPGMGGKKLAETLQTMQPDMKVMFMSGYTDEIVAHQDVLKPGTFFIDKPLIPSILTKKIREVLDK